MSGSLVIIVPMSESHEAADLYKQIMKGVGAHPTFIAQAHVDDPKRWFIRKDRLLKAGVTIGFVDLLERIADNLGQDLLEPARVVESADTAVLEAAAQA